MRYKKIVMDKIDISHSRFGSSRNWIWGPRIRVYKPAGAPRNDMSRAITWEAIRSDGLPVIYDVRIRRMHASYPKRYFEEMLACECPGGRHCEIHQRYLGKF